MKMWIAGRRFKDWELIGVFTTRRRAINACTRSIDFIFPITVNEKAPEKTVEAEDVEWPKLTMPVRG